MKTKSIREFLAAACLSRDTTLLVNHPQNGQISISANEFWKAADEIERLQKERARLLCV
jgi:hypothetical protein